MINDGSTELTTITINDVAFTIGVRERDKSIILDVLEDMGDGDWVYARMSPEQAKSLADALNAAVSLIQK